MWGSVYMISARFWHDRIVCHSGRQPTQCLQCFTMTERLALHFFPPVLHEGFRHICDVDQIGSQKLFPTQLSIMAKQKRDYGIGVAGFNYAMEERFVLALS